MAEDPDEAIGVGKYVKVIGTSSEKLNGTTGKVMEWKKDKERWAVHLNCGVKNLLPKNLRVVDKPKVKEFQFEAEKALKEGSATLSELVAASKPVGGCPNRSNPFHVCVPYCLQRWGAPTRGVKRKLDGAVERGKLRFRATYEFQEVLAEHGLPPGLEIKMNMTTGKNEARLMDGDEVDVAAAKRDKQQMQTLAEVLRKACVKNEAAKVKALLATTFYEPETLTPGLNAAAAEGYVEVVKQILLADFARPDPAWVHDGESALHRAMCAGHEECARYLLAAVPKDAARPKNAKDLDPFAAARAEGMELLAKRLERDLEGGTLLPEGALKAPQRGPTPEEVAEKQAAARAAAVLARLNAPEQPTTCSALAVIPNQK